MPPAAPSESSTRIARSTQSRRSLQPDDLLSPTKLRASSTASSLASGSTTVRSALKTPSKPKDGAPKPPPSTSSTRILKYTPSASSRRTSAPAQPFPRADPADSTPAQPARQNSAPVKIPGPVAGSHRIARATSMFSPKPVKSILEPLQDAPETSPSRPRVVSMTPPRTTASGNVMATPTPTAIVKSPPVLTMLSPSTATNLPSPTPKTKMRIQGTTTTPKDTPPKLKKFGVSPLNTPSKAPSKTPSRTPLSIQKNGHKVSSPMILPNRTSIDSDVTEESLNKALSIWEGDDSLDLVTDANDVDVDEEVGVLCFLFNSRRLITPTLHR